MTADPVRAIADAVLYEGYILWPYRRSALKNQRRFTFGGIYPPAHADAHPDDPARMQTEVLLLGSARAQVQITVRFLQVVQRAVARRRGQELEPVDELIIGDERYLAWDEAVEREIGGEPLAVDELSAGERVLIEIPADTAVQDLGEGAVIRSWKELRGTLDVRVEPLRDEVWRVSVTVNNETPIAPGNRQEALEQTFCSTHTLLRARGGVFASSADPPPALAEPASMCNNVGTWPVLVGEAGDRSTMLSSPIILEDYPRIAPESPGDLFDGGEIDQLLILNILTLTDQEKAEMAASDPRAREILERTEALTPEQLMALHGTIREFGMAR
jgi:hydrogenase maturation protease